MTMESDDIVIIKKPETVSYESIQTLLHTAHESNAAKGLVYGTANQTVEQLKNTLSKDSICFIAMNKNGKLVATGSVEFRKRSLLFMNFAIACFGLYGVLPEYKGRKLGNKILDKCIETSLAKGYKYIYCSTAAENNSIVRQMYKKRGFKKMDYFKAKANNFYSVRYLKWEFNSRLLEGIANFVYAIRRFYVRETSKL